MYTGCCGNRNTIEQEAMLREKIIENIIKLFIRRFASGKIQLRNLSSIL